MKKRRYPVRDLDGVGLPDDTWLYDHDDKWRVKPDFHPPNCTWCDAQLVVRKRWWRFCPGCDTPEVKR